MDNLRRSSRIKSGPAAAGGGDSAAGSEDSSAENSDPIPGSDEGLEYNTPRQSSPNNPDPGPSPISVSNLALMG